jgi:hypothetical protein
MGVGAFQINNSGRPITAWAAIPQGIALSYFPELTF